MKQKFIVPYETAKRLKEKGYPQTDGFIYDEEADGRLRTWVRTTSNKIPKFVAAPTYHEVVDWLESKGIRVFAHYYLDNGKWVYVIEDFKRLQDNAGFFPSREEALNAAILKALELI